MESHDGLLMAVFYSVTMEVLMVCRVLALAVTIPYLQLLHQSKLCPFVTLVHFAALVYPLYTHDYYHYRQLTIPDSPLRAGEEA